MLDGVAMSAVTGSHISARVGPIMACVSFAAIIVGFAPPASAQYDAAGYIRALDAAGLIDHDGDHCNMRNGLCHGQFDDGPSSLSTGMWVCRQVDQGRTRDSLVYELSHGEGLMPSSYNAPVIYDAATKYLC
jgi:hypothetical protein